MYAGTDIWGVFQSTDSGASWSESMAAMHALNGYSIRALVIDPATPSTLYAGTLSGVFHSTNQRRQLERGQRRLDQRHSLAGYRSGHAEHAVRGGR